MGRRCREHDWAASPLGPVEKWPQSLKTAAGSVVAQGIAQSLCWGPELIQIYNDSYRLIMGGKHPAGLGQPVLSNWSEVRDEIGPLLEQALSGETVYFEDLPLKIERHGFLEETFFTFSYSPVRDEAGEVGGVLVTSIETTNQVQARALQGERDRLLEDLQVERARLGYVFEHAPSFLAVLRGPEHVFELINSAYAQLIGHREVLGRPSAEALPEVVEQGFIDLLDTVLETGEPHVGRETPILLTRTPGAPPEQRFLDFTYIPLLESDGTRSGIIAHGADVTDSVLARREVERLLDESERARADAEAARAEAEEANRAKVDFLAAMSHDLRTPLNSIGGYVDLLDLGIDGPLNEAQRAKLSRVMANQRHLLTLIDDVLDFAKLEAGRVRFDLQPIGASELLASVEPLVSPVAESKGIDLIIDDAGAAELRGSGTEGDLPMSAVTHEDGDPPEDAGPPLQLLGDEDRVRQILVNLIGNAIKFTPEGGQVHLAFERAAEWVDIRVRDNGPGIEKERQKGIFDAFVQVGRRLSRPEEGVGLGLAISRELARAMGGELSLASEPDQGSTFTLRLPAAKSS